MLSAIAGYDYGFSGCTLQQHESWLKSLKCKVIQLDDSDTLEKNLNIAVEQTGNLLTKIAGNVS